MKDTDVQAQNTNSKTQSVKQGYYTTPEPLLTAVQYSVRSRFSNCNHATTKAQFSMDRKTDGFFSSVTENFCIFIQTNSLLSRHHV